MVRLLKYLHLRELRMSIFDEVALSRVIDGIGSIAERTITKYLTRRPFKKVTGFGLGDHIYIVLPERPASEVPAQSPTLQGNVHVTFHDMLAVNYAERCLVLSGVHDDDISIFTVAREQAPDILVTEHLTLICSPKANPYTRSAIDCLVKNFRDLQLSFELISPNPDRWKIKYNGADYISPSYSEADSLQADGKSEAQGPLTDFGLLGRFQSPWNPRAKILLISGIRGIGTWGAARYLRDYAPMLVKQ